MSYDAIVIGGGIVGTSTAYHLVRAGARTLLVDRRVTGHATDAGAGILSPATNTRDPDPWQRLAAHAVGYYPGLIESLESEQEGETGFAVCGMMIVAVSEDELEPFDVARRHIFNRRNRQGGPSAQDLYEISSDEARKRFPALAGVQGAIFYREAARVDGCGTARFFFQIVLPVSPAIIAVEVLFYGVFHWNAFFEALIFLNDPDKYPLQMVLRDILLRARLSEMMFTGDPREFAELQMLAELIKFSAIVVASGPILLLYPFLQRYFMTGVMIGSLKG